MKLQYSEVQNIMWRSNIHMKKDEWQHVNWPTGLKLKRSGSSRPLGRRVLGWRSSSKKACAQASSGDSLVTGVYSSNREQSAMASGGVRGLNT